MNMDYKERYEQALERAKKLQKTCDSQAVVGWCEYIFPELKESNDEHKNWILEYLYDGLRRTDEQFKDEFKAAIAWLEKQKNTPDKEYVYRPLAGDTIEKAAERAVELDGKVVLAFNGAYISVDNKTKDEIVAEYRNWVKKLGEQHSPVDINKMVDEFAHDVVKGYGVPSMIEVDAYRKGIEDALEKQADIDLEHYKDSENEKRKFVGYGFLKCKGDFLSFKEGETYWLEYIGKDNYNVRSDNLLGQTFHIKPVELYTVFRPTTWLEKQGEQTNVVPQSEMTKTSNQELEQKFHPGDWIVFNGLILHIDEVVNGYYRTTSIGDGIHNSYDWDIDNVARLWTIQDAKNGDVVVDKSDGTIGIFQSIGHHPDGGSYNDSSYCFLYCRYDDGFFYADFEHGNTINSNDLIPATKEQRDTLIKAMANAGYTFDFEKKELKKIESKTLDAAKVIEWLNDQACLGWIEDIEVDKFVDKFKKDFGL